MRRPVPLPAPPEPPGAGVVDARTRVDPPRPTLAADLETPADLETAGDTEIQTDVDTDLETDVGATAPVVPLGPTGEEQADAAASDRVGVRDVWAAARARRRALRAEVRRFTVRQRRRRLLWFGGLGAVVLLVLGSIGAAYSPLFAVQQVTVIGTSTLDPAVIAQALAGEVGTPLPQVDPSDVKAALVQFPLVESYTLEARPPHELVVRVVERTPIGVVASPAGYTLVDAAGVALATTPDAPAGRPVITATGGIGSPAFAAIGTVYRSLPADIAAQVTAMSATTANDVTLTLGGTRTDVVWGNADDSAKKAQVLASAMAARPPADVTRYDVSSPGAVVIR